MIILFIKSLWENLRTNSWFIDFMVLVIFLLKIGFHDDKLIMKLCFGFWVYYTQMNGVYLGAYIALDYFKEHIKKPHTIFSFLICLILIPVLRNKILWRGLLGNNVILGGLIGFLYWSVFFYIFFKYLIKAHSR